MTPAAITRDGLWENNPALVQLLGLAVSNTLINGLVLGCLTIFVLVSANGTISLLQRWLDDATRLPAQILIIATFVTLADLLLQYGSFELHQRIGLFVALIVTNCVMLENKILVWLCLTGFQWGLDSYSPSWRLAA